MPGDTKGRHYQAPAWAFRPARAALEAEVREQAAEIARLKGNAAAHPDGAHVDQGTLDALVLRELRYAFGRLTWVPEESASHVRRFWPALSPERRVIIRRDVAEHIEDGDQTEGLAWGDEEKLQSVWRPLLAWIDERMSAEGE